jgi:transposase
MRQILTADYAQQLLLPPSMEDWVGPEHPARFIREFVQMQDLRALGLDDVDREEGGIAYDPRLLLGVWLLGYLRKVRSTRALELACREEMGFVWLTGNHRPDHNALWRYWQGHRQQLRALHRQTVQVALEMNLVGLVVQALDGTKIAAAASGRGVFDRAHLQKLLSRVEAELAEHEQAIEQAGDEGAAQLPEPLQGRGELREKVRAALQRIEAGEARHAHPLEPEAARMECEGRNRFAYNAQAVVDAQQQIVLAAEVSNAPADHGQLVPMIARAQAACEPAPAVPTTLADGGYVSAEQLSEAERGGYPVVTPPPSNWRDTSHPYHAAHFRHDPVRHVVICPQGRELPLQRLRDKGGRRVEIYRSAKVCKDCPARVHCTRDRHGRTIDIQPGHAALVAAHARWLHPATAELYRLRAPTVEPVFAQIKQQMGFRRWTVRGLANVRTQWALLCAAWNLRVIYRHWKNRGPRPELPGPGRGPKPAGRPVLAENCSCLTRLLPPGLLLLCHA